MKFLVLVLFSVSCAHMEYETMYGADTMKKHKCDPITLTKSVVESGLNPSDEIKKAAEENTGYTNCTYTKPDADSLLMSCKSPMAYQSFTTKKPASCHKFMADNKLL